MRVVTIDELDNQPTQRKKYASSISAEPVVSVPPVVIPPAVEQIPEPVIVPHLEPEPTPVTEEMQSTANQYGLKHFRPVMLTNYIQRKIDKDINFWCEMDTTTKTPRKPVALIGDSGSGKNYAVTNYAASLGLPLLIVPCDDSQVLKELLGYWKAANGTTVWCEGLLSQFLRQPCVVLFDEVNCLPAGKLFMLHELLQNRKLFIKDAPAELSMVHLHPEARLFIAMNPPEAKYSGTNRLNTALANRAAFIEVRPFTDKEILNISSGNQEIDRQLIEYYKEASRIIKEQKLRVSISKRNIDTIATAVKSGLDIATAVTQGFINSALATASQTERDVLTNAAVITFGASKFEAVIKDNQGVKNA